MASVGQQQPTAVPSVKATAAFPYHNRQVGHFPISLSRKADSVPLGRGNYMKRLAYFSNTQNRLVHFSPGNLTSDYYTHALYAFAAIDTQTFQLIPTDEADLGPDRHPEQGSYFRFNCRAHALGMQTLISIGGDGQAASFSAMASSPASMAAFVNSAVAFAKKYEFDGLDLDWELPNNPNDRTNFVTLIKALRAKISTLKSPLLLTAAVAAYKPTIVASYSVPDLNQNLDWVSIKAYNLHGSWETTTGFHTALYDSNAPDLSINGAVNTWLTLGMSHWKVVVGLAAYGREWQLASPASHGVGAQAVIGGNQYRKDAWAYDEIVNIFLEGGATAVFDQASASMYAYQGRTWIGYDNPKSIGIKVSWALEKGLGGYMFWTMDFDSGHALATAAKGATYGTH